MSQEGWKDNPRYAGLVKKHAEQSNHGMSTRGSVHPMYVLFQSLKRRAAKRGVRFDITLDTVPVAPKVCPVLGIEVQHNKGRSFHNSPSVDRIEPDLGYIKDNIRIISHRANLLKSNASSDELRMVLLDLERIETEEAEGFCKS